MVRKSSSAGGRSKRGMVRAGGPKACVVEAVCAGVDGGCDWTVCCAAIEAHIDRPAKKEAAALRNPRRTVSMRPRPCSKTKRRLCFCLTLPSHKEESSKIHHALGHKTAKSCL